MLAITASDPTICSTTALISCSSLFIRLSVASRVKVTLCTLSASLAITFAAMSARLVIVCVFVTAKLSTDLAKSLSRLRADSASAFANAKPAADDALGDKEGEEEEEPSPVDDGD